jgi:hypothetical protein
MRAIAHGLYSALRGGGAVVEGAEFLVANHRVTLRGLGHALAAAACVIASTRLLSGIGAWLPPAPAISLPWYLVLVEWAWASLPSGLTVAATAWGAELAYLGLVAINGLVDAVANRRGHGPARAMVLSPRRAAWVCLSVGGLGCAGLAYVPVIGPVAALAAACPVLGAGFVVAILAVRGRNPRSIVGFTQSRVVLLGGLGGGILVSLALPVVSLVALPCAAAGTACLILREERSEPARTSEETVPYASPGK